MTISIITVCYNSSKTISRTIESVLAQKDVLLEYLIIDGAFKDNTVKIAESYRPVFARRGPHISSNLKRMMAFMTR